MGRLRATSIMIIADNCTADAASCEIEKGDWEQQLPKISRIICEPRKPHIFSYSKYLRYTTGFGALHHVNGRGFPINCCWWVWLPAAHGDEEDHYDED